MRQIIGFIALGILCLGSAWFIIDMERQLIKDALLEKSCRDRREARTILTTQVVIALIALTTWGLS